MIGFYILFCYLQIGYLIMLYLLELEECLQNPFFGNSGKRLGLGRNITFYNPWII